MYIFFLLCWTRTRIQLDFVIKNPIDLLLSFSCTLNRKI